MNRKSYLEKLYKMYKENGFIKTQDEYSILPDTEKCEYIRFHAPGILKSSYMIYTKFKDFMIDVYKHHTSEKDFTTEPFPLHLDDAAFYVYVDIDYDIINLDVDTATKINSDIAEEVDEIVGKILCKNENYKNTNILTFIPEELKESETGNIKCGAHTFILLPVQLIGESRDEFITDLNKMIEKSEKLKEIFKLYHLHLMEHGKDIQLTIDSLIDYQPISRFSSNIIPFAQKSIDSRKYKMICMSNTSGEDFTNLYIPKYSLQELQNITNKSISSISNLAFSKTPNIEAIRNQLYSNSNDNKNYLKPISIEDRRKMFMKILDDKFEKFGVSTNRKIINCCTFIFDFCSALATLDTGHPFLEKFKKGVWFGDEKSGNKFVKLLLDFYYVIFYLTLSDGIPEQFEEFISELIMDTIDPLFIRGGKTNRDDIVKQIQAYVNFCRNSRKNDDKNEDNSYKYPNKYDIFEDNISHDLAVKYGNVLSRKRIKKTEIEIFSKEWIKIRGYIIQILSDFTDYIRIEIMDNMVKEIEPFTCQNYTRDSLQYSFPRLRGNEDDKKYYYSVLQNLNKGYLFALLFQNGMQTYNRTIEDIIGAYTKAYVYSDVENEATKIYIYNIRQTKKLEEMPYNQWIVDNCGALSAWTNELLTNVIEPLSRRSIYDGPGGINCMFSLFCDEYDIIEKSFIGKLAINALITTSDAENVKRRILTNIRNHYSEISTETIDSFRASYHTNYFAVRNGILEYVYDELKDEGRKWSVRLLTDNRDKIVPSYSMAKYEEDYDYECSYCKDMKQFIREIYPYEKEEHYMRLCFASAVCPNILKNIFLFLFGTGADGKSTIDNIMRKMLGGTGSLTCYENNKQITLRNPHGYFGSMQPETMTNNKGRGISDEGGTINLKDRTYCVMQEPPKGEVKSETIKTWTGFGPIQARGMYEKAQEIVANCLIVCETNIEPSYDFIDDGIKRRIKVIYHQAKFVNDSNRNNYQYCDKYSDKRIITVREMDPSKIQRFEEHVEYWQAFLQILVKDALELLNNGWDNLGAIPAPLSIKNSTINSFKKSSNLSGWFENNIITNEETYTYTDDTGIEKLCTRHYGWLSVGELIEKIRKEHRDGVKEGSPILDCKVRTSAKEQVQQIVKAIENTYNGRIFKLKPELILNKDGKTINIEKVKKLVKLANKSNEEEYVDNFIINNIENKRNVKHVGESITTDNYYDLLVLGVSYKIDEKGNEEGEEGEYENGVDDVEIN